MEGALSALLRLRLLLFVVLPAAGWLTTNAPRPRSTAPQVGPGGRGRPLLCRDLREAGRGDPEVDSPGCRAGQGLDARREGEAFPDASRGGTPEGERTEGPQASLKVWSRLRPSNLRFVAPPEPVRVLPRFAVENAVASDLGHL